MRSMLLSREVKAAMVRAEPTSTQTVWNNTHIHILLTTFTS